LLFRDVFKPGKVTAAVVEHVAKQVGVPHQRWPEYSWPGRTIEYHRAQIRSLLGLLGAVQAGAIDGSDLAIG